MAAETIPEFLNQHSFLLLAVGAWVALAAVLLRRGRGWRQGVLLAVAGVLLVSVWLGLRPDPAGQATAAEIAATVGGGQPVLVEFYSDY